MIFTRNKTCSLFIRGKKFLIFEEDNRLCVSLAEGVDSDATAGLHEAAVLVAGVCGGKLNTLKYPERIEIEISVSAEQAINALAEHCEDRLREFVLHCNFPLHSLLATLRSCGLGRNELAKITSLSLARISSMLSDPYCCAMSETMARLRRFVMREFPVLEPLFSAADSFSRRRLGEMYNREKRHGQRD